MRNKNKYKEKIVDRVIVVVVIIIVITIAITVFGIVGCKAGDPPTYTTAKVGKATS